MSVLDVVGRLAAGERSDRNQRTDAKILECAVTDPMGAARYV